MRPPPPRKRLIALFHIVSPTEDLIKWGIPLLSGKWGIHRWSSTSHFTDEETEVQRTCSHLVVPEITEPPGSGPLSSVLSSLQSAH